MSADIPGHIRKIAHDRTFKISLRIGRSGVSESTIEELTAQLASRKVVKAKINRGIVEGRESKTELFELLAEKTKSRLVDVRGNVAIFWRS
jgi:RNA-binding protein